MSGNASSFHEEPKTDSEIRFYNLLKKTRERSQSNEPPLERSNTINIWLKSPVKNLRTSSIRSSQKPHEENKETLDPEDECSCLGSPIEHQGASSTPNLGSLDQPDKFGHHPYSQCGPSEINRSQRFSSQSHDICLKNVGVAYYVDASLQILFALTGFTDDLMSAFKKVANLPMFANWFSKIVAARQAGFINAAFTSTENFLNSLQMLRPSSSISEQQDASEFLIQIIEQFKLALPAGRANPVEFHFDCEMIENYHCFKCGKKRKSIPKKTSIGLRFPDTSSDLEQCLEAYMMEGERDLPCHNCHGTNVKTCSKFRYLPRKLIMSVNRFSGNAKHVKNIVPPKILDVRRFMENPGDARPSEYALVAQIVHAGKATQFGHCVSQVYYEGGKLPLYRNWSTQTVWLPDDMQSWGGEQACIYFYIRQSP